jgi:hypothetical protein
MCWFFFIWMEDDMAEREVVSPVTRKGSNVGSGQPLSPGARSMPTGRPDNVPAQPVQGRVSQMSDQPIPLEPRTKVVGPED